MKMSLQFHENEPAIRLVCDVQMLRCGSAAEIQNECTYTEGCRERHTFVLFTNIRMHLIFRLVRCTTYYCIRM